MARSESYWAADTSEQLLASTVGGALRVAVAAVPDQIALVIGEPDPALRQRWTYAEVLGIAECTARALLSRFSPGEHIAVWAANCAEWIFLEYGAALAGLVLVPVNPAYTQKELEYVLRQSRAVGVFYSDAYRDNPLSAAVAALSHKLRDLREAISFSDWAQFLLQGQGLRSLPKVDPDDPVQIQYTSGTTGFPKGALLHHRGITNNSRFVALRLGEDQDTVNISCLPLFHSSGCVICLLGVMQTHGTLVMTQFDPGLILELIESERGSVFGGVPTMYAALQEHADFHRRDLSSLQVASSGGSLVPIDMVHQIREYPGADFAIMFGQTESSPLITQTALSDTAADKSETIGFPLPHTEVKIIDPATGNVQPVDTPGELCARGYLVMKGYYNMPDKSAEAIDEDGWLHTGDLCSMDERGYCKITGRLKDMIIRGGENIYPREIEVLLYQHPDILEAAIVGIPDDKWGEQVAAFVRLDKSATVTITQDVLTAYLREHLAPFKIPRIWVHVDAYPLTGSGKIQKFVLRERWVRGELGANL